MRPIHKKFSKLRVPGQYPISTGPKTTEKKKQMRRSGPLPTHGTTNQLNLVSPAKFTSYQLVPVNSATGTKFRYLPVGTKFSTCTSPIEKLYQYQYMYKPYGKALIVPVLVPDRWVLVLSRLRSPGRWPTRPDPEKQLRISGSIYRYS